MRSGRLFRHEGPHSKFLVNREINTLGSLSVGMYIIISITSCPVSEQLTQMLMEMKIQVSISFFLAIEIQPTLTIHTDRLSFVIVVFVIL